VFEALDNGRRVTPKAITSSSIRVERCNIAVSNIRIPHSMGGRLRCLDLHPVAGRRGDIE
jgi:hypothetical protein